MGVHPYPYWRDTHPYPYWKDTRADIPLYKGWGIGNHPTQNETLIPMPPLYYSMTKAEAHHADVFTCDCGGFMFAGCGVKGGMSLDETLLMCSECNHEEVVKQDTVDEATP